MNKPEKSAKSQWSETIDFLRFPLMGGVVFIHFNLASGISINGETYGLDYPNWYYYIINLVSYVFASISVPCFFTISGFLFFLNKDFNFNVYLLKVKTRIRTLLIPFLLWNLIAVLYKLKCFIPIISSYYTPVEMHLSLRRVLNTFFYCSYTNGVFVVQNTSDLQSAYHPIDGPLWFVRELMTIVLISPIIIGGIKRLGSKFVLFLGLLWYFSNIIMPSLGYLTSLTTAAFFFSWGAYYSITNRNIVASFKSINLRYLLIAYAIMAIIDVFTIDNFINIYIHNLGIVLGVLVVTNMTNILLCNNIAKVNPFLANSSFFIFALHDLIIHDLGKMLLMILHVPDNPYIMLVFYFMIPIVTIIICIIIYRMLKSYMPSFCNLLTGSR